MRINSESAQAFIIDFQEKLVPAMSNPAFLTAKAALLIRGLKVFDIPMLVSQQYSRGLGNTIAELHTALETYSPIEKVTFSCLDTPEFRTAIKPNRNQIIVCGVESHVCVQQTVLELLSGTGLVFPDCQVYVVADAVDSRFELDKQIALERMRQAGAIICTVESLLFELTRTAGTDQFKAISKLVKQG